MALITQAEFARQQGFSKPYITKLVKKGVITLKDGKIDPKQALQSMANNAAPSTAIREIDSGELFPAPTGKKPGQGISYVDARTMREAFRAKLAKLEYEEKTGKLTDASKVKDDAFKAGRILRDELLGIPDRIADLLSAEDNPLIIKNLLLEELESALNRSCEN